MRFANLMDNRPFVYMFNSWRSRRPKWNSLKFWRCDIAKIFWYLGYMILLKCYLTIYFLFGGFERQCIF